MKAYKPYYVMFLLIALWVALLALALATLYYESNKAMGGNKTWSYFLGYTLLLNGPWVLLAPPLIFLFHKFPFRLKSFFKSAVFYLVLGVVACAVKWFVEDLEVRFCKYSYRPLSLATIMNEMFNYFTLVIGFHCVVHYYRFRDRQQKADALEAELVKAQLKMLKMQLNPHFLFNTLHAISSLVYDAPAKADRMISKLSDLLRISLESAGRQLVPLKEELDFLRAYLEIEQVRFEGRLELEEEINSETLDALTPSLILQPLVENALKHGVGRSMENIRLMIRASRQVSFLVLEVKDNGKGLKEDAKPYSGLGLENVRTRLQHLYGVKGGMDLISPNEEGGVTVRLSMPYQLNKEGLDG